MSATPEPVESINWKPSIFEIAAELLQNLGISPPESFDDRCTENRPDSRKDNSSIDNQEVSSTIDETETTVDQKQFDREETIERLRTTLEDTQTLKWKNNYFHEYLVEHFRRKQMMHVCTNESEDDALLNEYLKKLDELERSNEELRGSREEWEAELTRTREDIRGKKENASEAVNEMIARERSVGTSSWYCGKPLSIKRVQSLISRQLDRIKDIAKFRIRYTRLRDELIAIEVELRRSAISRPNLTKEDYERLEAEQFFYKRELLITRNRCDEFRQRNDHLVHMINTTSLKIIKINKMINSCERTLEELRNSLKTHLEEKKIRLAKMTEAKSLIREFSEIIEQSQRPEFAARMSNVRREHEEWMKKISIYLRDIKNLGQSLNSLRANLILHGKNLDSMTVASPEKSPCNSTKKDSEQN